MLHSNGGGDNRTAAGCEGEGESPVDYGGGERVVICVTLVALMVLTIAGNSLVISSVVMYRQMRTLTNYFVVSLAVADILVAVLVMPFGAYQLLTNLVWGIGPAACLITTCLDVMMTTTSILHLSCLAMDRYFAICNPFFYHRKINKRTVSFLLIACWVVPAFMSWVPILNGWNTLGIEDQVNCRSRADGKTCLFLVNIPYALICSLIAFYTPCIFMLVVNLKIYGEARRQALQIRSLELTTLGNHRQEKSMRQEQKAAKTLSIIMGAFCLCWAPFFVFNILDPFINYSIPFLVWQLALWLGYCNSTINPFLYYFSNRAFRKAFTKIMCMHRCRGIGNSADSIFTGVSNMSE